MVFERLPFDLTELIDGTLDQLSEVAANKNIGRCRTPSIVIKASVYMLAVLIF